MPYITSSDKLGGAGSVDATVGALIHLPTAIATVCREGSGHVKTACSHRPCTRIHHCNFVEAAAPTVLKAMTVLCLLVWPRHVHAILVLAR
jgi:hypothetical protein